MDKQNILLIINCGSSSLKYAIYEYHDKANELEPLCEGLAEKLNGSDAVLRIDLEGKKQRIALGAAGHEVAIQTLIEKLDQHFNLSKRLIGIGHRVVHGGESFKDSTLIDRNVLKQIENCVPLAPLHNPANLLGIELMQKAFPKTPQIAVFDTAFHQTMPEYAYLYAIPYALYEKHGIRRYGFHGTSHRYVSEQASQLLEKPKEEINLVTAHLGNGASVCAIKAGKSVDTSMGFTPLEGLVMGTRSGDIDPGIFDFLLKNSFSAEEISQTLNKESGLLGLSGESNDMRSLTELSESGNRQASIAIEVFCFRLAKYIAAMMSSLDRIDALIFTGGIGENAMNIRAKTVERLRIFGFEIDALKNSEAKSQEKGQINLPSSHTIMVIETDEELMIAQDTLAIIQ